MPRVTLRLLRREARRRRPRLARILPAVEPAGHGDHVGVPELLQSVRGHRRTDAAGAIEDRRFVLFGETILGPLLEITLRNVDRARNVARVPFVLLANVAELNVARADQVLDLLGCRLMDALLDIGEEIAICRHSSSLVLNAKPASAPDIPGMLGFSRGDAVLRPAPVPLPPGARDPRRWFARARDGGRPCPFHVGPLPGGCGKLVRWRARPLRWARDLFGDRAGDHERAQGGQLRGDRYTGHAPRAPLDRSHRPRGRDALLERVGESGGPAAPRCDSGIRRPAMELAGARRIRTATRSLASRDVSCGALWSPCPLPRLTPPRRRGDARSRRADPRRSYPLGGRLPLPHRRRPRHPSHCRWRWQPPGICGRPRRRCRRPRPGRTPLERKHRGPNSWCSSRRSRRIWARARTRPSDG